MFPHNLKTTDRKHINVGIHRDKSNCNDLQLSNVSISEQIYYVLETIEVYLCAQKII